jgi:hypothetical protein
MIYEVRTYRLEPNTGPEVVKRFQDAIEFRTQLSPLAAFFTTDIGPLNQIIHIWPYKDLNERSKIRAEAAKSGKWPPKVAEFCKEQLSEIFMPFDITPDFPKGKFGPIYEWRSYTLVTGMLPKVIENWSKAVPERAKRSPLTMAMYTDLGPLNKFVHIWPYKDLNERAAVRGQAVKDGIWPPKGGEGTLVAQENKICIPAPFSPLQ